MPSASIPSPLPRQLVWNEGGQGGAGADQRGDRLGGSGSGVLQGHGLLWGAMGATRKSDGEAPWPALSELWKGHISCRVWNRWGVGSERAGSSGREATETTPHSTWGAAVVLTGREQEIQPLMYFDGTVHEIP